MDSSDLFEPSFIEAMIWLGFVTLTVGGLKLALLGLNLACGWSKVNDPHSVQQKLQKVTQSEANLREEVEQLQDLLRKMSKAQNSENTMTSRQTREVYVTPSGECFHLYRDCARIRQSSVRALRECACCQVKEAKKAS